MDYLGKKKAKDIETFDYENIHKRLELIEEVVFGMGHGILKRVEVIESFLNKGDKESEKNNEEPENEETKEEIKVEENNETPA